MNAIIARPAVRATKAPPNGKATPRPLSPATTSATTRPAVSEASRAASEALTYVSFLMCEIVENDDLTKEFEVSANLFRVADEQAAVLAYGDDDDQPVEVRRPEIESLAAAINAAVESLDAAAQDSKLGAPMVVVTLAQHAQELLMRIADGLEVSATTLEPLKELTTYAGMRPYRDRPSSPIPRVGEVSIGYTHAQLRMVLEFVAGTACTLNCILMMAQTTEEEWECSRLVDAAQAITQQIGSVADEAVGCTVIGDSARWNFGPNFAKAGKAGAA